MGCDRDGRFRAAEFVFDGDRLIGEGDLFQLRKKRTDGIRGAGEPMTDSSDPGTGDGRGSRARVDVSGLGFNGLHA